jgi:hypothetical protein
MATTLFCRATLQNGIANYLDLSITAGASSTTIATVNTAASGTDIQWTDSGGGNVLAWISPPLASAVTIAGAITFLHQGRESATAANCGPRARVYKRSGGVETLIAGPADYGTEWGTSNVERSWTATPTSTAFAVGDQIVVKWYITNAGGTMGSGRQCFMYYDGAGGGSFDTRISLTETVTFQGPAADLEAAAASEATASGVIFTQIPLTGAALVISSASGDLTAGGGAAQLEGAASAAAAATGSLTTQIPLAGSMATVTSASGALTTQIQLDGAAIAQAIAAAGLSTGIALTADSVANAAANGNLTTLINLVAAASSVAQAGGSLDTQIQLAGAAVAVATATAQLAGGSAQLSGAAQAAAQANASLTTQIQLSGDALVQAMSLGTLGSDAAALAGNASLQVQAAGDITTSIRLTANALAEAISTGSLVTEILLTASAFATVLASGELTVVSLRVTPSRRRSGAVVMVTSRPRKPIRTSAESAAYPAARRPGNISTRRRTWH